MNIKLLGLVSHSDQSWKQVIQLVDHLLRDLREEDRLDDNYDVDEWRGYFLIQGRTVETQTVILWTRSTDAQMKSLGFQQLPGEVCKGLKFFPFLKTYYKSHTEVSDLFTFTYLF